MFVGHATAAFGLVALLALRFGVSRDRALALGVAAGLFATIPDVDMVYALVGLLGVDPTQPLDAANSFWGASTEVHRAVTHSLVVALPAAVAFALFPTHRRVATAGLLGLVATVAAVSGVVAGGIAALFAAAGCGVALVADEAGVESHDLLLVAVVGLATHPFGDVLTGSPPELLYPLQVTVFDGRVTLAADPTLHLLGAFAVELAAIWLGVYAALALADASLVEHVDGRATAGAAYALAALVIPPPTLAGSYQFVFSVVAVGFLGVAPRPTRNWERPALPTAVVTGLAAVTVAGAAYAVAYVTGFA